MITKKHYFRRYMLIFCLPMLLVGILLFWNNTWYAQQKAQSLHAATLSQVMESMDALVAQTRVLAENANRNSALITALKEGKPDAQRLAQWAAMYEDMLPAPATIVLYRHSEKSVILRSGGVPYGEFEQGVGELALCLSGFFSTLNRSDAPKALSLCHSPTDQYTMVYTYPLTNEQFKVVGVIAFLIPKATVLDLFSRFFDAPSAQLLLMNELLEPLIYSDQQAAQLKAFKSYRGIGLISGAWADPLVLRGISAQTRQVYFVTMSRADFYSRANTNLVLFYLLIASMLLFSGATAVALANGHYKRLKAERDKSDSLVVELDGQAVIIRTLVLRKLVDGSRKDAQVIQYNLQCANLHFYHRHFLAAVLAFTDQSEPVAEQCKRFFEGKNGEGVYFQCFVRPEHSQWIVLMNTDRQDGQAELTALAGQWLREQPGDLAIGISRAHDDILTLNHALVEASVALEARLATPLPGVYAFSGQESTAVHGLSIERAILMEAVRNSNKALVSATIAALFERIVCQSSSVHVMRCACYDMINVCIQMADAWKAPLTEQAIAELSNYQSPEMLCAMVQKQLSALCDTVMKDKRESLTTTKYNLIGFVQAHYQDSALSLAMLAEEFGLTQSYLSKLFKDETGQTFVNYVKQLRLDYVKKQLTETDLPVKDIILSSGYTDVANFTRSFKLAEGVAPGQYRANLLRMQA